MTIWLPFIDWNALSSIAQTLGVIATFAAVIVAIRINKPRIKVRAIFGLAVPTGKFTFAINVLNLSNFNVRIISTGISMRHKAKTIRLTAMNQWLSVHEEMSDSYNLSELKKLLMDGLAKKHIRPQDRIVIYATDSSGKYHYCKTKQIVSKILEIKE